MTEFHHDSGEDAAAVSPGNGADREDRKSGKDPMTAQRFFREWILPFSLEIIALWFVVTFLFYLPVVPSGSMEPTIAAKSMLFAWRTHNPDRLERGDILVFDSEELGGKNLIKRLVGLPGDTVEILEDGSLLINGRPYEETYVVHQLGGMPSRFEVPEGHYLFLGDNRADSLDARYWTHPYIPAEAVTGHAVFTIYPFRNFGRLS